MASTTNGTYTGLLIPAGSTQTITGSYILSDVSHSVATNANIGGGARQVVAPFISNMYAGASGEVGVLQQSTVTVCDIDRIFSVDLTEAHSKGFLGGFTVYDTDVSGGVLDSSSARIVVSISSGNAERDAFNAALRYGLENATDASSTTVSNYLKTETQTDVERLLNYDGLANLLEAAVLQRFGIALDASNGANNMRATMANGTALQRRSLFTQIDEERVEKYSTVSADGVYVSRERVAVMNFLPLTHNDLMALVWDVVVGDYTADSNTAPTDGSVISRRSGDHAPATVGALGADNDSYIIGAHTLGKYEDGSIVIAKPTLRRVAVRFVLKKDGAEAGDAFEVAAPGGDASSGYVLSLA
jgi:hypothetical protein